MTFQRQTDKKPFQFQIIPLGMNPIKDDATSRIKAQYKGYSDVIPRALASHFRIKRLSDEWL